MKKGPKLLFVAILIIAIAAGIFLVVTNIDTLVKGAIEKYGSRATGTSVRVSSVDIGLREGRGLVSGLSVDNPGGFKTPRAFSLGEISIDLDTASITKDPIVIDEIRVSSPKVIYEINKSGKANINKIRDNVSSYASSGKASRDGGKKLLVRRLIIEDGKIEINIAARPGEPLSANLGRIELKNVGGKGGSTPGEIAAQVMRPLTDRAIQAAAKAGVGSYLGQEADRLKEEAAEKMKGIEEEGGGAIKNLLGR